MARGRGGGRGIGSVNFIEMVQFEDKLKGLNKNRVRKINEAIVKEQAKSVLGNLIRLTPVGQYKDGRVGGTLRRGWTVKTQKQAENGRTESGVTELNNSVEKLKVQVQGKKYTVTLHNPVEYASYVNYGHRTRGGNGYVNGQFFVEKALQNAGRGAKVRMEKVLIRELRRYIHDDLNK